MKKPAIQKATQKEYDLDNSEDKAMYDAMLNECSGEIKIGCLTFDASRIVEELDPVAYRCGFNDYVDDLDERWICPICGDQHDNEDSATYCCQDEPK
jgi:hypothetical protein